MSGADAGLTEYISRSSLSWSSSYKDQVITPTGSITAIRAGHYHKGIGGNSTHRYNVPEIEFSLVHYESYTCEDRPLDQFYNNMFVYYDLGENGDTS